MVTPLKEISGMPVLPYEPVACKQCSAVLNPYARVDYAGKIWICQFCFNVRPAPPGPPASAGQSTDRATPCPRSGITLS